MTSQREVLLRELRAVTTHPTADELYGLVRRVLPRISLGTVYRNLDVLHRCGLVLKLPGGPQARFDGRTQTHYHICCVSCGHVDDLAMRRDWPAPSGAIGPTGYRVLGHRLEFFGLCPRCRKRPDARKINKYAGGAVGL